jgi:hypothetical protein
MSSDVVCSISLLQNQLITFHKEPFFSLEIIYKQESVDKISRKNQEFVSYLKTVSLGARPDFSSPKPE